MGRSQSTLDCRKTQHTCHSSVGPPLQNVRPAPSERDVNATRLPTFYDYLEQTEVPDHKMILSVHSINTEKVKRENLLGHSNQSHLTHNSSFKLNSIYDQTRSA